MDDDTYGKACSFTRNEELYVAGHRILTDPRLKPLLSTLIAGLKPSNSHFTTMQIKGDNHRVHLKNATKSLPQTAYSLWMRENGKDESKKKKEKRRNVW